MSGLLIDICLGSVGLTLMANVWNDWLLDSLRLL